VYDLECVYGGNDFVYVRASKNVTEMSECV